MKEPENSFDDLLFYRTELGVLRANCYVIPIGNGECVAIDIGGQPERIIKMLDDEGLVLRAVLLTHGHFDHIGGVEAAAEHYDARVYIHSGDAAMLDDSEKSLGSDFRNYPFFPVKEYETFEDGDVLKFGEEEFTVLHTPGHSDGSSCFLCRDCVFSGDTLFRQSVGRTDLVGSSPRKLMTSLKKITALCEDRRVLPGHGEETTLDFERKHNPYL